MFEGTARSRRTESPTSKDTLMELEERWSTIHALWNEAFRTSFHFSVASVRSDGSPHVSPIGSVLLLRQPGRALYFEEFTRRLPQNFEFDPRVSVLAVRSGTGFWLGALLRGRFRSPPAIRLNGVVGPRRDASESEVARIRRRFRRLRFTRGYKALWETMSTVRDIEFHTAEPILLGPMTRGVWGGPEGADGRG